MDDEYTYNLCLNILGYEHFSCVGDEYTLFMFYIFGHETFSCVEDGYTYYLCSCILGYQPFCCVEDE